MVKYIFYLTLVLTFSKISAQVTLFNVDFQNGIPSNFDINKDLNILEPQKNLQDYLKPWKVLNLIPRSQSDLNKIVLQTFFSLKRLCCINILQDTDF